MILLVDDYEEIYDLSIMDIYALEIVQVFIFFPPIIANEVRETQATEGKIGLLIKGKGYSSHVSSQGDEMQSTLQPDFFTLFEESSLCLTTESDCIYVSYKPSDSTRVVGNFL